MCSLYAQVYRVCSGGDGQGKPPGTRGLQKPLLYDVIATRPWSEAARPLKWRCHEPMRMRKMEMPADTVIRLARATRFATRLLFRVKRSPCAACRAARVQRRSSPPHAHGWSAGQLTAPNRTGTKRSGDGNSLNHEPQARHDQHESSIAIGRLPAVVDSTRHLLGFPNNKEPGDSPDGSPERRHPTH